MEHILTKVTRAETYLSPSGQRDSYAGRCESLPGKLQEQVEGAAVAARDAGVEQMSEGIDLF